jgi:hypothetical protein
VTRALAAALVALLAALVWVAQGAAYGTSTAVVNAASAPTHGTWANAPAGAAAAGGGVATLTETNPLGIATQPANGTFTGNATGWTSASTGNVDVAYDGGVGNPAGSARTRLTGLLLLLSSGSGTWSSQSFVWSGASPLSASLSIQKRFDALLIASASWRVTLKDLTTPALDDVLVDASIPVNGSFTTDTVAVPTTDLVNGHTYRIEVKVDMSALAGLGSASVWFDNATLTAQQVNYRAEGEMTIPSVAAGSTMTLAVDAGATGEAFDVQVWNGTAWNTRLTVPVGAVAPLTYGLLSSERVGGQVRVRFVDRTQSADGAQSSLSVDYVRVISTGGITVSGPTSVTLPGVTIDGVSQKVVNASFGAIDVADGGGVASGWSLTATATRWAKVGAPSQTLPANAWTAVPQAPTAPNGDSLTGVTAGAGGTFSPTVPIVLMTASPGNGVGTFRQNPAVALTVPLTAYAGVYRSTVTLTAS